MYIYPGVQFAPTSASTIVVNFGALPTVRFEHLLPEEFEWLMSCSGTSSLPAQALSAHRSTGIAHMRSALIRGGFARATPPSLASGGAIEWEPELSALQSQGKNARRVLHQRHHTAIAIRGLTRVTLSIIRTLAASGFRHFIVDDDRPVAATDLWADPLYPRDQDSRSQAVGEMLKAFYPNAAVVSQNVAPAVAILSSEDSYDFAGSALFGAFDVPHLNVLGSGQNIVVGPFVLPGVTPNLCCYDQEVLGGLPGGFPQSSQSSLVTVKSGHLAESGMCVGAATAEMASVLAAQEIVAFIDGNELVSAHGVLTCKATERLPHKQAIPLDDSCLCAATVTAQSAKLYETVQ